MSELLHRLMKLGYASNCKTRGKSIDDAKEISDWISSITGKFASCKLTETQPEWHMKSV
jgi:hypothetical protein